MPIQTLRLFAPDTVSRAPLRLDEFLRQRLPSLLGQNADERVLSNSKIRRLIMAGMVSVDREQCRNPAFALRKNAVITVKLDTDKLTQEKQPDDIAFELTAADVLFEDESIIVVNKPANFPTEKTMVASRDNMHAATIRYLERLGVVAPYVGIHHRLDRETSGVLLFSKNRAINPGIHQLFLTHAIVKEYQALTIRPQKTIPASFSVDNDLGRISPKSAPGKWGSVKTGGDHAHTDFRLLETRPQLLRILATPLTGRTHQIRVHLSGFGLPLLGDPLYGGPTSLPQRDGLPASPIPRVMLHAFRLSFIHPGTQEPLSIEAPLPADFASFVSSGNNSR